VETGVKDFSVVTPYFDSMIAKIIVHGENRDDCIDKTLNALKEFSISGLKTTVPFCRTVLRSKEFREATYTTHWIDSVFTTDMLESEDEAMMAALAATITYAKEYLQYSSDSPMFKSESLNVWVLNKEALAQMKEGVRIINLSRGELVNDADMIDALEAGIVSEYVTDFPNEKMINVPGVIPVPHLGASTPESENNCAVMAVLQTKDFLENGNIRNSVNFPVCDMGISIVKHRLTIAHKNIPKMLGQISAVLAEQGTNIANMINRSRGDYAYTMVDLEEEITDENVKRIKDIAGVLKVRVI